LSIAKSAPSTAPMPVSTDTPSLTGFSNFQFDGVDISLYNFFDIDLGHADDTQKSRLKDIYDWAMSENKTLGDGMLRIRSLETRLGQPPIGMSRINKLWNFIKIEHQMSDLRKRQEALENKRIYA
jgi:hypothetical protein